MLIQDSLPSWLLALAATATMANAGPPNKHHDEAKCTPVSFKFTATAENYLFSPNPDPNSESDIQEFYNLLINGTNLIAGTQTVSGTFTLNGIYCSPSSPGKGKKTKDVLEILIHGASYDALSWLGWNKFGDKYNYPLAAAREGYHTLAIDRLGHGTNPDRPDPVNVVQSGLQMELFKQLITSVKTSSKNPLGKTFKKVVWVGHSWGSMLGIAYARLYKGASPSESRFAFDALVGTGISSDIHSEVFAQFPTGIASRVDPVKFASLAAGYLTYTTEEAREASFYAGEYDPAIPKYDFAHKDTVTVGEFAAVGPLLQGPVLGYTKPTMIVTGANDAIFCVKPGVDPRECDKTLEKTGTDFFPDVVRAGKYEYFAPRNTGHDQSLHYAADEVAAKIHQFLDKYL
ncbi:Alpha/Beta hydrolase protein [Cladorrhinum sp. PSN259]|nr:Alpha/Beta hydrolase protein [Cladorrhinum sp. PSN259]